MAVQLYYGSVVVGEIASPFEHQGTWFGNLTPRLSVGGSEIELALAEFIAFSERWHERLKAGDNPDAAEFDAFGQLVRSDLWAIVDERGTRRRLDTCPVFVDGEVTWSYGPV